MSTFTPTHKIKILQLTTYNLDKIYTNKSDPINPNAFKYAPGQIVDAILHCESCGDMILFPGYIIGKEDYEIVVEII